MTDAASAKALGAEAFKAKDFPKAIEHFSSAIHFSPSDHTLFGNRSVCHFNLQAYDKALEDANACVQLKPDWSRGY